MAKTSGLLAKIATGKRLNLLLLLLLPLLLLPLLFHVPTILYSSTDGRSPTTTRDNPADYITAAQKATMVRWFASVIDLSLFMKIKLSEKFLQQI